jgi:adenosyl cobinamide kinase/adenosyl cobinamide phosphate guanylyltransferase
VTYVATAVVGEEGDDGQGVRDGAGEDLAARVAAHRARRPEGWRTVELARGADLAGEARRLTGTLLIDSLGMWLAGTRGLVAGGERLCRELTARSGDAVIVSDEVGLGVHPSTGAGLAFRDALGQLNRELADVADEVVLVVAGRVLRLAGVDGARAPRPTGGA